ncbi:Fc.00g081050.m01.CDS01 [Cosmosporella sp. VM-42]
MSVNKFDVVVVGGGNTACCAALAAHEAGARVAVIEAAPKNERGGNSRFSGTAFRFPHGGKSHLEPLLCPSGKELAKQCTMGPYTAEQYTKDMLDKSHGKHDTREMETIIEKGYDTIAWMARHGVPWMLPLNKFLSSHVTRSKIVSLDPGTSLVVENSGVGLMDAMWAAVERTSVQVFYETPAHDLIIDGERVSGVRARCSDGYVDFHGVVILACGGFEANPRMRRQYLGPGTDLMIVRGTRFNTGQMLERALAAGAKAQGHWGGYHSAPQDIDAPAMGDLELLDSMSRYSFPYGITVNVEGRRFINEGEGEITMIYAKVGAAIGQQTRALAFQIFDQKTLHLLEPRYSTAKKSRMEANSLEELARQMSVNVAEFVKTVKEFNAATQIGATFDEHKKDGLCTKEGFPLPKSNWAQAIDAPPYVAYAVTNGITFTFGGIKADTTNGKVLTNEDNAIKGLYAAGEITGGFHFGYAAGASLIRSSVIARIAGGLAAAECQPSSKAAHL